MSLTFPTRCLTSRSTSGDENTEFVRTYEAGGTPNPCIDCNRFMKFSKLLDFARAKGMNYVVTGHYARVEEKDGRFILKKALDETKDQSYVLYSMTQEELSHVLFPLGEMRKTETRRIAEENGFVNSHKPDSQDICFVPDGDYVSFMEQYTGKHYPEGDFLDENGNVIGRHRGIVRYTIGQRRGLGIAAGQHVYVYKKDIENNTVYVGAEEKLYTKYLTAGDVNWIVFDKPNFTIRVSAMTRYRHKEQPATLYPNADGTVSVEFDEKQRAVTPGTSRGILRRGHGSRRRHDNRSTLRFGKVIMLNQYSRTQLIFGAVGWKSCVIPVWQYSV